MSAHPFLTRLAERTAARREAGLARTLLPVTDRRDRTVNINGQTCLNFASNDFLGLAQDDHAAATLAELARHQGCGSGASRLVTGTSSSTLAAEQALARYFGYESCLILNSGFTANLTLLATLFADRDTLLVDKRCHTSSMAGVLHSRATMHSYRHNNLAHLEKLLHKHPATAVITESLFSMDADSPDFKQLKKLKHDFQFISIIDEAHSFGVLGDNGRGLAGGMADIAVGTLGKAFGMFGAFVLMPETVRDYLIHFGQGFIYTTALPPWHGDLVQYMLQRIAAADDRRHHLRQLGESLRRGLRELDFEVQGEEHILAIRIGDEHHSLQLSAALRDKGLLVFAARYPTVPLEQAILRICLTAAHTRDDITRLCETLDSVRKEIRP